MHITELTTRCPNELCVSTVSMALASVWDPHAFETMLCCTCVGPGTIVGHSGLHLASNRHDPLCTLPCQLHNYVPTWSAGRPWYTLPPQETGYGSSVVNVSSVNGKQSFAGTATYCGSKAALDHMSRCAAVDLAPDGIRVNVVNPGVVVTPLQQRGGMDDATYACPGVRPHPYTVLISCC
jgi:NAD(P)-dependent dehydrogenase (short-subunit alcohol dehydrogenase family)